MVHTQTAAKQFFADKVIRQAHVEAVALSDAERHMLLWSESDPAFRTDPRLVDELASQISDDEYEAKIAGLLARAFAEDRVRDAQAAEGWRQARSVLQQGDHYIAVMIDRAVGRALKRWWQLW